MVRKVCDVVHQQSVGCCCSAECCDARFSEGDAGVILHVECYCWQESPHGCGESLLQSELELGAGKRPSAGAREDRIARIASVVGQEVFYHPGDGANISA